MIKFKPIVFNDGDFRSVKYTDTVNTTVLEGTFCVLATTGADLNTVTAKRFSGFLPLATATIPTGSAFEAFVKGRVFPIMHETIDPENIGATINQNDFVVSFNMVSGNEFEIHETVTESGFASTWTAIGGFGAVGSTGKLTPVGAKNATGLVVVQCLGTFNAQWIRLRVI